MARHGVGRYLLFKSSSTFLNTVAPAWSPWAVTVFLYKQQRKKTNSPSRKGNSTKWMLLAMASICSWPVWEPTEVKQNLFINCSGVSITLYLHDLFRIKHFLKNTLLLVPKHFSHHGFDKASAQQNAEQSVSCLTWRVSEAPRSLQECSLGFWLLKDVVEKQQKKKQAILCRLKFGTNRSIPLLENSSGGS